MDCQQITDMITALATAAAAICAAIAAGQTRKQIKASVKQSLFLLRTERCLKALDLLTRFKNVNALLDAEEGPALQGNPLILPSARQSQQAIRASF